MKNILRLIMLSFLMMSMQCEDDNLQPITQEMLNAKKTEVLTYINQFSCSTTSTCNSIAFGAKPCGGPREYLAFPSTVDIIILQNLVDEYYEMDNAYNIQTNAVSDCLAVSTPTTLDCVNGNCIIID
jgi:hypothetical protein